MRWTPNKVTLLRVVVGFAAVCLFGRGAWANLTAVGVTVAGVALDAVCGPLPRKEKKATPGGAPPGRPCDPTDGKRCVTPFPAGGGVRGGVAVRARGVGEPYGGGADRGGDRA